MKPERSSRTPKWTPTAPQMEPKSVHVTPKSAQAEHKSAQVELQAFPKPPKASQSLPKVSQSLPKASPKPSPSLILDLGHPFGDPWAPLGDPLGTPWGPLGMFWAPKDDFMKFYRIYDFSQFDPKTHFGPLGQIFRPPQATVQWARLRK